MAVGVVLDYAAFVVNSHLPADGDAGGAHQNFTECCCRRHAIVLVTARAGPDHTYLCCSLFLGFEKR